MLQSITRVRIMIRHLLVIAAAAALAGATPAAAQQGGAADYPNKPIRIIVTVPAGGGVDTATRIVADKLQQRLGQPVVIENRGGASGNIAAEAVFTSEPDGYTLMASQPAPITTNVVLYKKLNFDPTAFSIMPVEDIRMALKVLGHGQIRLTAADGRRMVLDA